MNDRSIVMFSMVKWDSIRQRPQQLAMSLSEYYRILYIDPVAYSILGYFKNHLAGNRTRNLKPRLHKINENLNVYTPPPLFPLSEDLGWVNTLDHHLIVPLINEVIHKLHIQNPILWVNNPYQLPVIGSFENRLTCYDCMDSYAAFCKPGSRRGKLVKKLEDRLLSLSNVVFTTAQPLYDRIKQRQSSVFLVRNAVGEQFLNYPLHVNDHLPLPPDWPEGEGPVIGYIGSISRWLDTEAILQIAQKHPTWRVIMIGPVHPDQSSLLHLANVYCLGEKSYDLLPAYVSHFDVGVIPFRINDLTLSVNPVKLYEYFAIGIPVVASNLPELQQYKDLCELADGSLEIVTKAEHAVEQFGMNHHLVAMEQRRKIALANTWGQRANEIVAIIDDK